MTFNDDDADDYDGDDDNDDDSHRSSDILHLLLCDHPIPIQVVKIESPPGS